LCFGSGIHRYISETQQQLCGMLKFVFVYTDSVVKYV
jgi:hypothetical protein